MAKIVNRDVIDTRVERWIAASHQNPDKWLYGTNFQCFRCLDIVAAQKTIRYSGFAIN